MIMRSRRQAQLLNASDTRAVSFQKTDEHQFMHIGLLREYLGLELGAAVPGSPEGVHGKEASCV